jgi:hypothetical protein
LTRVIAALIDLVAAPTGLFFALTRRIAFDEPGIPSVETDFARQKTTDHATSKDSTRPVFSRKMSLNVRSRRVVRWSMKPGMLLRMRELRGLTCPELSAIAKVSERQLSRLHKCECDANDATIRDLANALKCTREELANPDEKLLPAAASSGLTAEDTKQAQREARLGLDRPTIELLGRRYPVLSFSRMIDCETRYSEITDPLVVSGLVRDYRPIPDDAADILVADQGRGAAYFRIAREIPGVGAAGGSGYLQTTVFAPTGADGKRLLQYLSQPIQVNVMVKIVARPASDVCRGFPRFDKPGASSPWGFVVTEVMSS